MNRSKVYLILSCVCFSISLIVFSYLSVSAQEELYTIVGQVFEDENCSGQRISLKNRLVILQDENMRTIKAEFTGTLGLYGFDVERGKQYYVQATTEDGSGEILTVGVFATQEGFGRRIDFNVFPCRVHFPIIDTGNPSQVNNSSVPNASLVIKLNEKECGGTKLRPLPFIKVQFVVSDKIVYEDFTNEQGLVGFANLPNNLNAEIHVLYFRRQIVKINTGNEPIKRIDLNLAHCPILIPLISVAPPFQN